MAKKKKSSTKSLTQKELKAMLANQEAELAATEKRLAQTEEAYTSFTTPSDAEVIDPDLVRNKVTGLSPAQLEARQALLEAQKGMSAVGLTSTFTTSKGFAGQIETPPETGLKPGYEWYAVKQIGGGVEWKQRRISGFTTPVVSGGSGGSSGGTTAEPEKNSSDLLAAFLASQEQAKIDAAAAAEAAKRERAENAITVLTDRFTRYGLASLVPRIKQLAISGASESTITLQLQESEEYKTRFKANQDRIKKGLRVLDPGDYLNLEDDYRQILRAYGLKAFDTDAYVQQFIANDIATTELSNRVVTAVQRVQNADPAILTTLRSFYGISDNDLVAYVLDPNQQFQKIERQVAAAEIGAAAGLQGISTGVSVAEQLAAQGVTKAQAQKGYATIADILPTADKLSGIYQKALPSYGLAEAEQEVFNTLASAQRKRRALAEREIAEFSGASGLSKSALSKQIGGTY